MAADKALVLTWLGDLATSLVTDAIDLADLTRRLAEASALSGSEFAGEALSLMRAIAENVATPSDFALIAEPSTEDSETQDAALILVAIGLSIAGAKASWPSRPQARIARSQVAAAGDAALSAASAMGGDGADLFAFLSSMVSTSVRVISEIAANSVPVVRIETGISLPSTLLAYQLYGDAKRAQGIVEIARSGTPMLMPVGFDALAG